MWNQHLETLDLRYLLAYLRGLYLETHCGENGEKDSHIMKMRDSMWVLPTAVFTYLSKSG